MNTANEKQTPKCGRPEPILFDNNAEGIIAPSVTAKSQMAGEGYVESDKTEDDE